MRHVWQYCFLPIKVSNQEVLNPTQLVDVENLKFMKVLYYRTTEIHIYIYMYILEILIESTIACKQIMKGFNAISDQARLESTIWTFLD